MTPDTLPGLAVHDTLAALTAADADRFRFVVSPDDVNPDGPLEWGGVTVVSVPAAYGSNLDDTPTGGTDPLDLTRALDRFADGVTARPGHYADPDRFTDAAIRWAAVFHGRTVRRWALSVSQSSWVDGLAYLDDPADDGAVDGTVDTLTAWARGEVYRVELQRCIDADADTWEGVPDCDLWGNYLDDDYTAADVAVDNFGVPRGFAEAVAVVDSWDIR